jgi:hypothetical protein
VELVGIFGNLSGGSEEMLDKISIRPGLGFQSWTFRFLGRKVSLLKRRFAFQKRTTSRRVK